MNLLLFSTQDYTAENRVEIRCPEKLAHIADILKKGQGDCLKAGVLQGRLGTATIESFSREKAVLSVNLDSDPPEAPALTLVCALPRPKVFRRILFGATCLGVKKFHFIKTWRVDKSYWNSPLLLDTSTHTIFLEALAQCADTIMPQLSFHRLFKPFVEDILPDISQSTRKLLAHPYAQNPFPFNINQAATLVLGPEGGFIPFEIDLLEKGGFLPVSAGRRILSVENAVVSLIPRLYP